MLASNGASNLTREAPEHLRVGERFGKNRIRPCLQIKPRAIERPVDSLDGGRVGARDDAQMSARAARGRYPRRHLIGRDQQLVIQMAALLRQ